MDNIGFAIPLAGLSSLGLAVMVITDRLMVGDCYRNNPNQALVVSSFNGMFFGLLVTLATWLVYVNHAEMSFVSMVNEMKYLTYPYGLLMMLSGVLAVQVVRHYFEAFVPEKGHEVNETAVAIWLASSPIWIFATIALIQWYSNRYSVSLGYLSGLDQAEVSWQFGALMCLTVVALVFFEKAGQGGVGWRDLLKSSYLKHVFWLQVCMVTYIIIMSGVLEGLDNTTSTLALLPFFWIGFGSGALVLLQKPVRSIFVRNWKRLCYFWRPIMVVEVVGMLVFYFEYLAISEADPTLVNLILSAHVILVFLFNLYLRRTRRKMERQDQRRRWFLGMRFLVNKLPETNPLVASEVIWFGVSVILLTASVLHLAN